MSIFSKIRLFASNNKKDPKDIDNIIESSENASRELTPEEKNMLNKKEFNLVVNHIKNSGLPFSVKKYFSIKDLNKILSFMIKDKKNNSEKINLVLLKKIGKPIFNKQYSRKKLSLFLKKFLTN